MRVLGLLFVLALVGTAVSTAAPQIDIKAKTALTLDKIRLRGDGAAEVTGQLIDKLTGDGIAGQSVAVKVGDQTVNATTGVDGKFRGRLAVPPGPQPVVLRFHGAPLLEPVDYTTTTDPSRAQVSLTITIEDAPGGAQVLVTATADDQPAKLPIELATGSITDSDLKPLQNLLSGTPFLLTRKTAGAVGPRRVRATFRGDDSRQTAITEATVELTVGTRTTLDVSSTKLAFEDDLNVTGQVLDEDNAPVPRAAVTLSSGDRRLAQGATTEDGSYKFNIEAEVIGQGQFAVQVSSDPGTAYVKPSRSDPAIIKIAAPQPVPVSYTIAAFLSTVLAAGGFLMARAKPWKRFHRQAPPADVPSTEGDGEHHAGGLVVAKPGLVSTLRRAADDGFSGVVRDTVRGRPIEHAVVRLLLGDVEREARTSPEGGFTLDKLGVGGWAAEVAAPGHVTEKFIVSIPHHGELRGVRVDLVPVRERVFQLYRRAAEPILPESRLWGVWSPRQIVDHVRSKRPSPALAELTDFVEELYFSGRIAAETVLPLASERVDKAIHERSRPAN